MRILVINPNSTEAVTRGIDEAVEPLRMAGGPAIDCVTLKEGPPGIETQAHVESVVAPISATVKNRDNDCSAFVIACYSDPGLHAAREVDLEAEDGVRLPEAAPLERGCKHEHVHRLEQARPKPR